MSPYHTLLPRYLQDALRRAAQQHEAGSFLRLCAIEHAIAQVKLEYSLGFRNDLQK